ncbi:hypothetical protein Bca52824_069304 [Brassica carinata]|uniref:Protein kinase domain-containing protein n=1 Tax=Brassica carinata TaxID=52824 RepID=A0A8X7Q4B5_BRACI|nr:hypothetical protein Bca52824_069304 [Brassica carinata]
MHRVLKPENFLFVSKHENSLLKTIDLDSPCYLSKMMFFTDVVGRPYYVAPEADVWSAGVIVLLSGVPPSWLIFCVFAEHLESEQGIFEEALHGDLDLFQAFARLIKKSSSASAVLL